jgi:aminodeoxyfutalosine synthase
VTVSDLAARLAQARRLSDDEIGSLAGSSDIITIGMMADEVRRRLHGTRTTFLRVADVQLALPFGGAASWPPAAGEIRIVGTPVSRKAAVERVREVSALAKGTPVSGFSLSELERLASDERVTLRSLLEELQAAGLELVAEAAFDRLQDPKRAIEEVNISGLALARLTIHQLSSAEMPDLFRRVADLQRRVGVIRAFAPLPRLFNAAVPTTGYDDLKRVALARLIVGNIPSIQVDWSLYGPKLAQVALTVGADDVDAVSAEDDTSEGRRRAPLEEIRRNIRAASQEPVERNGRFEPVDGPAPGPTGAQERPTARVNANG